MEQSAGRLRQAGFYVDLGSGRRVEVDYDTPDRLWLATASGVQSVEAWIKELHGVDVRIRIDRTAVGLLVSVDLGDSAAEVQNSDGGASVLMRVDQAQQECVVTAAIDNGEDIVLKRLSLPRRS
jgi:hypothetical protein